jgi:putative ABC transport system permease protein
MRRAVWLGLRLAGAGAGSARLRSASVALASAIGTLVLLVVTAVVRADQVHAGLAGHGEHTGRLLLAVVLSIALPVLVLAATAGRLSAELRDRRLANLRLLGLTATQTRLVAVAEGGVTTLAGAVLGWASFWVVRPLLATSDVAGRDWTTAALTPRPADQVLVISSVVLVVVLVAATPRRLDMRAVMRRAHRADVKKPSVLRLVPLVAGSGICGAMLVQGRVEQLTDARFAVYAGGALLLAVGLILVVPVLVRLLADLILRHFRGPVAILAGRRLQAQPAAVTRVVAALLIGLFLVTGSRSVVVAFEHTPQYISSARDIEEQQRIVVQGTVDKAPGIAERARQVAGVEDVVVVRTLSSGHGCVDGPGVCVSGLVASCEELRRIAPELSGCVPDEPMWLTSDDAEIAQLSRRRAMAWFPEAGYRPLMAHGPVATFAPPSRRISGEAWLELDPLYGSVLIPPSFVDLSRMPDETSVQVLVLGEPGRGLAHALASRLDVDVSFPGYEYYDFVDGLRAIVWSVAAVILSVGLLALAIAAVDRAVTRRREVVALQLVGVSPGTLRRVQWLEAALPIAVGTVLAIGLGFLAGATYLVFGGE